MLEVTVRILDSAERHGIAHALARISGPAAGEGWYVYVSEEPEFGAVRIRTCAAPPAGPRRGAIRRMLLASASPGCPGGLGWSILELPGATINGALAVLCGRLRTRGVENLEGGERPWQASRARKAEIAAADNASRAVQMQRGDRRDQERHLRVLR